jgi:hypothetical protein
MPSIRNTSRYRIYNWAGGLNLKDSSYMLQDNELQDCKNIELSTRGAVSPRRGWRTYEDTANSEHMQASRRNPIHGIYRYVQSNGNKEVVFHAAGELFRDNGSRVFTYLADFQTSDNYVSFAQWRDTLFVSSKKDNLMSYHRGASTEVFSPSLSGNVPDWPFMVEPLSEGTLDPSKYYSYRFTFDLYHNNDFLGETVPLNAATANWLTGKVVREYITKNISGATGVALDSYTLPLSYLTNVKYINVYRTIGRDAAVDKQDATVPFYWLGRIDADKYKQASFGDTLFKDLGYTELSPTGQQIQYGIMDHPVKAAFVITHKNRMWYANVVASQDSKSGLETEKEYPYRIYYSEYLKPITMDVLNWFDVGHEDGEPITGLVSWRNKMLLVFKPNSIWAVLGADVETGFGEPSIQLEMLSNDVGCIAPQTISMGDNFIIWLSNRGVYYFDGTVPKPLKTELVNPIFNRVQAHRKYYAVGKYFDDIRQYWIAVSDPEVNAGTNALVLKFDFYTGTWARHVYSSVGINDFLEFKGESEMAKILGTNDQRSLILFSTGAILEFEGHPYEQYNNTPVDWYMKTKYIDCQKPETDKQFTGIMVWAIAPETITVEYDIDSGAVTGSATISPIANVTWDNFNWDDGSLWQGVKQGMQLVKLPDTAIGKRIAIKLSGSTKIHPTEIQGITIFYKEKERIN